MAGALIIKNPKRRSALQSGWADLFPYYAGYPEEFAKEVLLSANLAQSARVFDPWNGSGSTTSASAILGLKAVGFDLNPVMTIVARARLLPTSEYSVLRPLSRRIIQHARSLLDEEGLEPLTDWFDTRTASVLRCLERSVREHLVDPETASESAPRLSSLASTFYVALFSAARSLSLPFRASNPTWLRIAKSADELLSYPRGEVERRFLDAVERARASCSASSMIATRSEKVLIETADSAETRPRKASADFVLTSPPYCTRIDYTCLTRVELALLSGLLGVDRGELSAKMLGSIRVPKNLPKLEQEWGPTALTFLEAVGSHPSHASAGYYLKSHVDYFSKLFRSLRQCSEALKPGARAVLVVQDSVYKGIHNNLQTVLTEMASALCLEPIQREDFSFPRSMRDVNSRSLAYGATGKVTESVLVFRKLSFH